MFKTETHMHTAPVSGSISAACFRSPASPDTAASTASRCTQTDWLHTAAQPRGSSPTRGTEMPLPST